MAKAIFKNARLVIEGGIIENGCVEVADGLIRSVQGVEIVNSGADVVDLAGSFLLPGFIDIHIHGARGIDVNSATAEELLELASFLAGNGVTAWVPTLVPDSEENYRRAIGEIDRLMKIQQGKAVAQAIGVHFEGVFANETMCGALRPEYFKSGRWVVDGGRLPKLRKGIHLTTLAPEIEGGIELIKLLADDGWTVSIGHTRADPATLDRAYAAGARHMTHFFNAMTGVHHRDIGVAGWGLAKSDVAFDVIADGIHVHPEMLRMAVRAKSPERVSLISDSVAPTGLGDGDFEIWGERVTVKDGRTRNARGSIAGSVITMHDAVKRMLSLGFSFPELARMASTNPARLLGVSDLRGSIEPGKRADLVSIADDGSITFVMIGGKIVVGS